MIQLVSFVIFTLLTVLRMTVLAHSSAYVNNSLMGATPVFLAYVLIIFSLFNTVFIGGFFKTAYYIGKPFVAFAVLCFIVIALGETLYHIPGLEALNSASAENMSLQLSVLTAGIAIYVVSMFLSYASCCKKFDKIDL